MKNTKELHHGNAEYLIKKTSEDAKAIGIFYAPQNGNVERIARKIRERLRHHKSELYHITDVKPEKMLEYRNLILVASTLGSVQWENDVADEWIGFLNQFEENEMQGRRVALVGLGDHVGYPDNFCDGIGDMSYWIRKAGGTLVGRTPTDGYTFDNSHGIRDNLFDGLPLDEENETDKTDERIDRWLSFVLPDFAIEK